MIDYGKVLDAVDIFLGQRAGEVDDHVLHLVAETISDYNYSCYAIRSGDLDGSSVAEHDNLFSKLETCEKILGDLHYPWARRTQTMLNIYWHDQLGTIHGELNEFAVDKAGIEIHSIDEAYTHFGLYDFEREPGKPNTTDSQPVCE